MEEMEFPTYSDLNLVEIFECNSTIIDQYVHNKSLSSEYSNNKFNTICELNRFKPQIDEKSIQIFIPTIGMEMIKKEFQFGDETILNQDEIIAKIPRILTISEALQNQKDFISQQKQIEEKFRQKIEKESNSESEI